ncbi:nucleoside/nucleotide kinase family protein [Brachybacterium sp. AOP25-B2-12]|uniref:nucleoside/nucleotide kinase family protein n=1 Tax=Brachybacterium sp. AOP25-B2-12 TaxID=3457710 RepID=UPI004034332F
MSGRPAETSFDELVARARCLVDRAEPGEVSGSSGRRVLLGIAGPPGAGKSTLAAALVAALDAERPGWARQVPMDGFHLADAELERLGRRDRKGAPDPFDVAGYAALLARLRETGPRTVYAPAFDRAVEQPIAGSIPVGPAVHLVVTEGNYLLESGEWAAVRPLLDEVWWVDAADAEREQRLTVRHEGTGHSPEAALAWARDVDGVNAVRIAPSRVLADLVVPGDLPLPGAEGSGRRSAARP